MPRHSIKRQHNLPAHRLRLIGREQDLVVARQALLDADGRLLTLTGTGGCGKTRLALELAADLLPTFPDGVWLVELAPLEDAGIVPQAVVSALGVREQTGEALLVTLVRALATREVLLVLDNCEHVIEGCAQVLEHLLDHCPRLRVLTTSREALRITGELTWRVPSLRVPDQRAATDNLLRAPAVQLFVERAQATVPTFDPAARAATVADICRRLDGLPLAIELAAARVQALGVDQILARLDDSMHLLVGGSRTAPSRQQTLRATLDWSYDLLAEGARAVFRRLAVFAESFSLDAAEAVCVASDIASSDVLDELQHLVEKSLVVAEERQGQARYHLLEPVRQYAQDQLVTSDERGAARWRHAMYYLAFAEVRAHDTNIGGPRRLTAAAELDSEYPNIRVVLAWTVENGEAQVGLRLAGSLSLLWQMYGSTSEGLGWLAQLLSLPGAEEPTTGRAWALLAGAWLAILAGDFKPARGFCQEALAQARGVGEPLLEWMALMFSGWTDYRCGDFAAAGHYLTQSLACARAAGEPVCEAPSLNILAMIACDQGDYAAAQPLAEEAVRLARATQDTWNEGWALGSVGRAALGRGALDEARAALEAGHSVARQQGQLIALSAFILNLLGEFGTAMGQLDQAAAWLVASMELQHEGGERWAMTQSLERFAALDARRGQSERALRLAGAADALYERLGTERPAAERQKLEDWLLPVRDVLGNEAVEAALTQGRALEIEDALALVRRGDKSEEPARVRATTGLTAREQQVAALLRHGLSNRQIAEQLVITERTVASHIEHILEKLGFASRHQVGAWLVEHSLLG
jgi:predicted ATPase/DNA-binding CsgD family transcriptional regulator